MTIPVRPTVVVASVKKSLATFLNSAIVKISNEAIRDRGVFTLALSGGSLPSMLSNLGQVFDEKGVDPRFDQWHVILADERCVLSDDPDSNLGAMKENFFANVAITAEHVYGINEQKIGEGSEEVAFDYEKVVKKVLALSGDTLDLAILGFGPDGHTCSLFPNHPQLLEQTKWITSIDNSPKPPPKRITLTFPVLNQRTRHVIFCGAGESKAPIVKDLFATMDAVETIPEGRRYKATPASPPPFPCAMVQPLESLTWMLDEEAMGQATTK